MKILITGSDGYIGKALVPLLLENQHDVTLLSRKNSENFTQQKKIIAEPVNWADAIKGEKFDVCIHLAWIATPGIYLQSEENELLVDTSLKLAKTLYQNGLNHFVGIGTCIEYSPKQITACHEENSPTAELTPYAKAKHRTHSGIAELTSQHDAQYSWARIFYPYGVGEDRRKTASHFFNAVLNDQSILLKTPHSKKDFIETSDLANALCQIASSTVGAGCINVGTGQPTSIIELAKAVCDVADKNHNLIITDAGTHEDSYAYHVADNTKLQSLGWRQNVSIMDGLTKLFHSLTA